LKAWGAGVTAMGTKIFAVGAGVLAPLLASVKQFMSAGDALDKMSSRVGASVEFLSALSHAAQIGGTDISAMEVGIRRMQRTAYDAARGLSTATDAFGELGIEVRGADGQLKSTEQLFMESAAALSRMENNTKKAALATVIFGRAGTQLLPMLKDGSDGLTAVMEEAQKLGLVMSGEDATAAAELTDAWTRLTSVLKMAAIRIGAALAPSLTELAERITKTVRPVIDWIKRNGQLIVSVMKIAAVVAAVGAGLIAVGGILFGLGTVFSTLAGIVSAMGTALGTMVTALAAILSPIGLVIASLVSLGGYLLYVSGAGQKALAWLGRQFTALKENGPGRMAGHLGRLGLRRHRSGRSDSVANLEDGVAEGSRLADGEVDRFQRGLHGRGHRSGLRHGQNPHPCVGLPTNGLGRDGRLSFHGVDQVHRHGG